MPITAWTVLQSGMSHQLVVYEFSRGRIESGDFQHFLGMYGPPALPRGVALALMMDSLVLCIDGYDQDPREVYAIRQIREFYRSLHQVWPYSLFFFNLAQDSLRILALCCLPEIVTIRRKGSQECGVEFDALELVHFLSQSIAPMNALCEQAGMSEPQVFERTRAVFRYFRLPFEFGLP